MVMRRRPGTAINTTQFHGSTRMSKPIIPHLKEHVGRQKYTLICEKRPHARRSPQRTNAPRAVSRLMDKLGIHDASGLVRYAIREKLIEP